MTIVLDRILTVAIGDVTGAATDDGAYGAGERLSLPDWDGFKDELRVILGYWGTIVADTEGEGVTSDQPGDQVVETTHVFVVILDESTTPDRVRREVAEVLPRYGQGSACFAFDGAHEPVFATADGFRPQLAQSEHTHTQPAGGNMRITRTNINILDRITEDEVVNVVLAEMDVKVTDPFLDISDALYEWALDSSNVDEEVAQDWALDWAMAVAE